VAKKPAKNTRKRSKLDDPKGARRSMDAEMSYAAETRKGGSTRRNTALK